MTPNINPDIAALPLYKLGFHNGQDTGLRLALDQLTQERIRQTQMQATHDAASPAAARHEFAAGVLSTVAKRVAAIFRQETAR
jgi:hypothetical protein